jgi:hypothetical protein
MHPNLLPHILQLQTASIWFCSPAATASFPFLSFPAAAGYQSVALSVPVALFVQPSSGHPILFSLPNIDPVSLLLPNHFNLEKFPKTHFKKF